MGLGVRRAIAHAPTKCLIPDQACPAPPAAHLLLGLRHQATGTSLILPERCGPAFVKYYRPPGLYRPILKLTNPGFRTNWLHCTQANRKTTSRSSSTKTLPATTPRSCRQRLIAASLRVRVRLIDWMKRMERLLVY